MIHTPTGPQRNVVAGTSGRRRNFAFRRVAEESENRANREKRPSEMIEPKYVSPRKTLGKIEKKILTKCRQIGKQSDRESVKESLRKV
jgi:hypothetical protein